MDYFSMNRWRTRKKERKRGGKAQWKNGIFLVGKWNFEPTKNMREECQPSYVPQLPFGDFAGVSIPLAAMVTGMYEGG